MQSLSDVLNLQESNCGLTVQLLCMTFKQPSLNSQMKLDTRVSPRLAFFHCSHSTALKAPGSCPFQTHPWTHCLLWQLESETSLWAPCSLKLVRPEEVKRGGSVSFPSLVASSLTENKSHWLKNTQSTRQALAGASFTGQMITKTVITKSWIQGPSHW